jgi:hypothetical protein
MGKKNTGLRRGDNIIILKHVEYAISDREELENLLDHVKKTAADIDGVEFKDIYFPKGKEEFILIMECVSERKYMEWREICPPPEGARDWYEVLATEDEHFNH